MIKIIGVYNVPENDDVSLVEVIVDKGYSEFDLIEFTQADKNLDSSNWQAPFGERYLDLEGVNIIGDNMTLPDINNHSTRIVFFLYFLDVNKPLLTPFGSIDMPAKTSLPERLIGKVHFIDPE